MITLPYLALISIEWTYLRLMESTQDSSNKIWSGAILRKNLLVAPSGNPTRNEPYPKIYPYTRD